MSELDWKGNGFAFPGGLMDWRAYAKATVDGGLWEARVRVDRKCEKFFGETATITLGPFDTRKEAEAAVEVLYRLENANGT